MFLALLLRNCLFLFCVTGTFCSIMSADTATTTATVDKWGVLVDKTPVGTTPSATDDTDMLRYLKLQHVTYSWHARIDGDSDSPAGELWPQNAFTSKYITNVASFWLNPNEDHHWQVRNEARAFANNILTGLIIYETNWLARYKAERARLLDEKTVYGNAAFLESYTTACSSTPVLEILSAWLGYDNWEGASVTAQGGWSQTVAPAAAVDITKVIQDAFASCGGAGIGGLYIQRSDPHAPNPLTPRDLTPKYPRGYAVEQIQNRRKIDARLSGMVASKNGKSDDAGPYYQYVPLCAKDNDRGRWNSLMNIPDVSIPFFAPRAVDSIDDEKNSVPALNGKDFNAKEAKSYFPDGWQVDSWLATPASVYSSSKIGAVTIVQGSSLATPDGSNLGTDPRTVGIVYRDANGVHFRRFEGWQNIALPSLTAFQINAPYTTKAGDSLTNDGGYFYSHQLEENGTRGLVTATVTGSNIVFMANDRAANSHTTAPVVNSATKPTKPTIKVNKDIYSFSFNPNGYFAGLPQPWSANGPDFHSWTGYENNLFQLIASTNGTHMVLQDNFPSHDMNHTYDAHNYGKNPANFNYDSWNDVYTAPVFPVASATNVSNIDDIFWPWCTPAGCAFKGTAIHRAYYDENGTLQLVPGSADFDPTLSATKLPAASGSLNLWWAFDNGTVLFGVGTPTSQADIDAQANGVTTLMTRQTPYCRYLRNFGFRQTVPTDLGGPATANTAPVTITQIKSLPLNPAQKFCTPPFLNGKFLFWRDVWSVSTPDAFSVKFKARGDGVQIAFGPNTATQRFRGNTMDTSFQYSLVATGTSVTINRFDKNASTTKLTQLTPTMTPGAQILGGNGVNREQAYDYWVTFNNGFIQFGQGATIGQNLVATAFDTNPLLNNSSFSFSSNIRSIDYTNITADHYAIQTLITNAGTYSSWNAAQYFSAADNGSIIFNFQNSNASPTAATQQVMIGLATEATYNQAKAALASATGNTSTPQVLPDYQVLLGSRSNSAYEILRKTTSANSVSANPALPLDSNQHTMWLLFNKGAFAYGNGSQPGQNILGSWTDPSPISGIRYFCFTSPATTMQISLASVSTTQSQATYAAAPGMAAQSQTLWRMESANQGAFSFSIAGTPAATSGTPPVTTPEVAPGIVQIGLTNDTAPTPIYDIMINDAGTAYINKAQIKQTSTITTLKPTQLPTSATTATPYWVVTNNGTIIVGTGTTPLAPNTTFLTWQDPAFDATPANALTKFTLAAGNNAVNYSNITTIPLSSYSTNLTPILQSLTAQTGINAGWAADPSKITIASPTAQSPYYWSEKLKLSAIGQGSISCTFAAQSNSKPTLSFGVATSIPVNGANAPAASVALDTNTGIITISPAPASTGTDSGAGTGTGGAAPTVPTYPALLTLTDGKQHSIWMTINGGSIAIGIDTPLGTSPVYRNSIAFTVTDTTQINYVSVALRNGSAALTTIATGAFTDLTSVTTDGSQKFQWQPNLILGSADQGALSFTVAAQQQNTLTLNIGLGLTTAGKNPSTTQLNDAQYVLCLDYTGQIYLLKTPNLTTKINPVRFASTDPKYASVMAATSTSGANCSLSYDHGRFNLSINGTSVWSYADQSPITGITNFAFTSLQSIANISAISSSVGASLQTIQTTFSTPLADIAADTGAFVTKLQGALLARLHVQSRDATTYFFSTVITALQKNYELFTDAQRAQLASAMNDVAAEPTLDSTQKAALATLIPLLSVTTLPFAALITDYQSKLPTVLIGSTAAPALATTDPKRQLFILKLQKLANLQATDLNAPGVLTGLQALVALIPPTLTFTGSEATVITALQTMTSSQAILANSQDPDAVLKTIQSLADYNQQITALVAFLNKRATARAAAAQTPTAPSTIANLSADQVTKLVGILSTLVKNRDWLTSDNIKNVTLALQLAAASPDLTTAAGTLTSLKTTLTTPVAFSSQVTTAQSYLSGTNNISIKPSTDASRQLYFAYLANMQNNLSTATNDDVTNLQKNVLVPLLALPLSQSENGVITSLQAAINSAAAQNNSFASQLTTLQNTAVTLVDYINGLSKLLQGKGISVLFTANDFDTFYKQLAYVVNSRELLQYNTDGSVNSAAQANSALITNLLQIATLAPELNGRLSDINNLLTLVATAYTFADRITSLKTEVTLVINRMKAAMTAQQNTSSTLPTDYFYARLLTKLNMISKAPGVQTNTQYNDLQLNVINPLFALTNDPALGTINANLNATKTQVLAAQGTFAYQFAAAQAQQTNMSMYISMLLTIITGERQGTITFGSGDAQTFYTALQSAANNRDSLSANDLTNLLTAINYAIYSKSFTSTQSLVAQLQTLYAAAATPLLFADRVTNYASQVTSILAAKSTDQARINFFNCLSTLLSAPGTQTKAAITTLSQLVTTLMGSPLASNESTIVTALNTFLTAAQNTMQTAAYQITQLSQSTDLGAYISGLQKLLSSKGISVTFGANDFELFYSQLQYLVDNRELLVALSPAAATTTGATQTQALPAFIQQTTALLQAALIVPELATHKQDITTLLATINTPHLFADRVAYLQTEVATLVAQVTATPATQTAQAAGTTQTSSNTPSAQTLAPFNYLFDRIIGATGKNGKLTLLLSAPGMATQALFDQLDTSVISPLITLLTADSVRQGLLNTIRTNITSQKSSILQQQTTFAYNFNLAVAQKANISTYISMLLNIISNERQGLITFDNTSRPGTDSTNKAVTLDADDKVFVAALEEMVLRRDSLAAGDLANLVTALNYAQFSKSITSDTVNGSALVTKLQTLSATAATPMPFADRITAYVAQAKDVLSRQSTDPIRMTFFQNLSTVLSAPGLKSPESIKSLTDAIITPFNASPLSGSEQSVMTALTGALNSVQGTLKSAAYQINVISMATDLTSYITGLKSLLTNKGISVTFSAADFDAFYSQLQYLVDNRELLANNSTKSNDLIALANNLLTSAQLVAELAPHKQDIATLITTLTTPHLFADRVAYLQTEVAALIAQITPPASASSSQQQSPDITQFTYWFDRIITKLNILTQAPGIATGDLFDTLDTSVMSPLLTLLSNDSTRQGQLQKIRTTIINQKSTILTQQKTFAYNFAAAQAQQSNMSLYINMLENIITNERQGIITFNNTTTPTDAQTFTNALAAVVNQRDILGSNDIATLLTAINYAQFSQSFAGNPILLAQLQTLTNTASTPLAFADRVTKYVAQAANVLKLAQTDPTRIAFFAALNTLPTAPGTITPEACNQLQTKIVTPYTASPLGANEQTIISSLANFLASTQTTLKSASYQIIQLSQSTDLGLFINGLQTLLGNKGVSVTFTQDDFTLLYAQLQYLVDNRELLTANSTPGNDLIALASELLNAALVVAEFAPRQKDITALLTALTTPHLFADRINYLQTEIKNLGSQIATATAAQAATDTPANTAAATLPKTGQFAYLFDRIITKLSIILTAPGIATTDNFNQLDTKVITPLLTMLDTSARIKAVQDIRTNLTTQKSIVMQQQGTFAYQFAAAQTQVSNTSLYISMLLNIISSERQGTLTFDNTTTGANHTKPDTQTFTDALLQLVNTRSSLSSTDVTNLLTAINYAIYSKSFAGNTAVLAQLQNAYTTASVALSFTDLVSAFVAQAPKILPLPATDPARITFFTNIKSLLTAPGVQTPAAVNSLNSSIITPFNASPLTSSEQATISALNNFMTQAQTTIKAAAYQLNILSTSTDLSAYISGLKSLLSNKGVSVIFAPADFDTFYGHLAYLVDNRELLAAQSTSTKNLTAQLTDLLNTAQIVPELSPHATDMATLVTNLSLPHTFADRITYLQNEVTELVKKAGTASSLDPYNYAFDRIIAKLNLITTAPGLASNAGFNQLDVSVITPLLALLAQDSTRQAALQQIRTTIMTQKPTILQQQKTFAYQFAAAQAQIANTSTYISMLNAIITGERQSQITFDANNSPSDAQVLVTALTALVTQRDLLSASDITTLNTLISSALLSTTYASQPSLKNALTTLQTTLATPILFADRVSKYAGLISSIINAPATDQNRINFFKALQALISAPGDQTTAAVNALQNNIIKPLSASPLSQTEQNTLNALNNFLTNAQTTIKTATYKLSQIVQITDISAYVTALQDLFNGLGTRYTFTKADYQAFVDQLTLLTNSRELLSGAALTTAQSLVNATQLSANFSAFSQQLTTLNTSISQPFYFNDRVTALVTEAESLVARNAASTDVQLVRMFAKLQLLPNAPQLNTTDAQFNTLETQVLTPISGLALSTDQVTSLEQLRGQLASQKAQILANQTTFSYNFKIAQSQIANLDVYIASLKDIMVEQHNNALTFSGNDSNDLLTAITDLVNQRDALTPAQLTNLGALISYCAFSSIYQNTPAAQTLNTLYQQLNTPLPLATLVPKYVTAIGKIIYLPSTDAARIQFFNQLNALTKLTEPLTPALAQSITTNISGPLKGASPSLNEQATLQALDAYLANANKNAQSVSYLLQVADSTNLALFDYAQAVAAVIKQSGTTLTFSATDITNALGALAYVVNSREMLTAAQITALQQFIAQLIWLGIFPDNKKDLQTFSDTLGTVHLIQDIIANASQELKVLILGQASPTGNRILRLIARMKVVLNATGPITAADFATLQNTILTPLQGMALSADQQQIVSDLIARVAASSSTILAQQATFAYNFAQAQLIQNNPSNYISALQNIITMKRQSLLTFQPADYQTFIAALKVMGDQRDGLSATDLTNLQNTINYTYYSSGFNSNPQYQQALLALYTLVSQPVTFASRVAQYAASINSVLQLDSTDLARQRFFTNINNLPNLTGSGIISDVQTFVTSVLTPLQSVPLSPSEQTVVTSLNSFVQSIQNQAKALSYNLNLLATQITAAQADPAQNSVDVLLAGLNNIIVQRAAGNIVFAPGDFATMMTFVQGLADNREILSQTQAGQAQNIIHSIEFSAGFESYKPKLEQLYAAIITPLTFQERLAKYKAAIPGLNSTPTTDPTKNQFLKMVSTIFTAPGNPTAADLNSLQIDVLNAISYGNFTADQKNQVQPLSIQLAAMQSTIASFAYRLTVAQNCTDFTSYFQTLTQMVTDFSNGSLTLGVNDFGTLLTELESQAVFVPLNLTTPFGLPGLLQMIKSAPTFATRADLIARITALTTKISTPQDPVTMAQYFTQNAMSMLSKPATDGMRNRFFAALGQFSTDLNSVSEASLIEANQTGILTNLQVALNQYQNSSSAQPSEATIMTGLARQLQNITLSVPAPAAAPATTVQSIPTSLVTPATQVVSNGTVSLPATQTTAAATQPVSRFYRSAPTSRFAQ